MSDEDKMPSRIAPLLKLVIDMDVTDGVEYDGRVPTPAEVDRLSADLINQRIGSALDAHVERDTGWAAKRIEGLHFVSPEALHCFLFQRAMLERPEAKVMTPVYATRLGVIARALYAAQQDAALIAGERAS